MMIENILQYQYKGELVYIRKDKLNFYVNMELLPKFLNMVVKMFLLIANNSNLNTVSCKVFYSIK